MTPEVAVLTSLVEELRHQNRLLTERCAQLETENKLLRRKVDLLVRRCFGAKSESLSSDQLELLLTGNEEPPPGKSDASRVASTAGDTLEAVPKDHSPAAPKPARRPRLPEHLPVVEEFIDPPEVLADPAAYRRIGEERTEQLDYTPGRFFQRHTVRGKYVRKGAADAVPVIAPLSILQDRCIAAPALLAHIIVAKYCDHLPLYRQERIFKTRHDVLLPRQTMARWLVMAAFWLSGVCREITGSVLEDGYVQIDETAIKYLDPGHGKSRTGYLWVMHRPGGGTVFQWRTSRATECLESLIPKGWNGTIQCDGYSAYGAFAKKRQRAITLVACMAHSGGTSLRPKRRPRSARAGCSGRSRRSIKLKGGCGSSGRGQRCARPSAPPRPPLS